MVQTIMAISRALPSCFERRGLLSDIPPWKKMRSCSVVRTAKKSWAMAGSRRQSLFTISRSSFDNPFTFFGGAEF
jgi:hypothetical protein